MASTAKHAFSPTQRYAIYQTYGKQCYVCRHPLDLRTMEVDHIIPETLPKTNPDLFKSTIQELGLSSNFDTNTYENWLPICPPCNKAKGTTVFKATPQIQLLLQRVNETASHARALEEKIVQQNILARALNTLQRAAEQGLIDDTRHLAAIDCLTKRDPGNGGQGDVDTTRTGGPGGRIIYVADDQTRAICVDDKGNTYEVELAGSVPDIYDRGTQEGIIKLIKNALDVAEVWDTYTEGEWAVLCLANNGGIVELSRHETRGVAIWLALLRIPPATEKSVVRKEHDPRNETIWEVTDCIQPFYPYCYREYHGRACVPLGPGLLESYVNTAVPSTDRRDTTLEIVTSSIAEAVSLVKFCALYFSHIRVNETALGLSRVYTTQEGTGFRAYVREQTEEERGLYSELLLAEKYGVVTIASIDYRSISERFDRWFDAIGRQWPKMSASLGFHHETDQGKMVRRLLKNQSMVAAMLPSARGVSVVSDELAWHISLTNYAKWMAQISDGGYLRRSERGRFARRYRTAVTWPSGLSMTEILELRSSKSLSFDKVWDAMASLQKLLTRKGDDIETIKLCEEMFKDNLAPLIQESGINRRSGAAIPGMLGIGCIAQSLPGAVFRQAADQAKVPELVELFESRIPISREPAATVPILMLCPPERIAPQSLTMSSLDLSED